jgi:SAM-dependent methyltransferase
VKGDVQFYIERVREFGGPVLEIATGTGRVLWPIARAGFDIVGIDISHQMLAMARAKGEREDAAVRERVKLHQADMTSFRLKQSFQLAMIPFRAFQHLTLPEQQRAALNCINQNPVASGHLIIDVFDPHLDYCIPGAPSPMPKRRVTDEKTGSTAVRRVLERTSDPVRQVFTEKFRLQGLDQRGDPIDSEESEWTLRWRYPGLW